jgi:DNA repair protein SbcC/Rad50
MRLRTIALRNYRRFANAVLELPNGVIAITGPNGAGKSTLIEAIAWCLFGHDAARTNKDLLKRTAAAPGDDVEVRIDFELDGQSYHVQRRLRGKSLQSEAQLTVDGALVVAPGANSSDLVTRRIARALGMDRRGFLTTVVANQGELSALSDVNPGERRRLILGLLGVDEIDAAIAIARTRKREAAVRLDALRRALAQEAPLRERAAQIAADLRDAQAAHAAADVEARQRAQALAAVAAAAAAEAERRQRHRELHSRLDHLQRSLQVQHAQLTRLGAEARLLEEKAQDHERLREQGGRFAGLDDRWAALEAHREAARNRDRVLADLAHVERDQARWADPAPLELRVQATHEALEAEVAQLRTSVESHGQELVRLEQHALHLDGDRRRLAADAADHGAKWRDLATLGADAVCPLCQRSLGDAVERLTSRAVEEQATIQHRLAAIADQLETVRSQAAAAKRAHDEHRLRLVAQERILDALRRRRERERLAETERARLAARRVELEAELAALPALPPPPDAAVLERERHEREQWRTALARLEADIARLPKVRAEVGVLAAEAERTRSEIEGATREARELDYQDGAWETASAAEAEERRLLADAERRRDVMAERASGLDLQRRRAEADLVRLEGLRSEAATLEEDVRLGEWLAADRGEQGLLPEFRNHVISRIRPALARAAADLVAEMTHGRYADLAIDEDYTIRVYDGGQAWPLERFSGGERDAINLAVRMAVSELLARARRSSQLQFVALDEVLASQDESRRRSVLEALKTLGTHFRQVLLVTHLDEVRERVDHVLRVVPQGDGTSRLEASWDVA